MEDVVTGACGYCAKAFHTVDGVEDAHVQLLNEYEGHPSIRTWSATVTR